jgi:hypothetical protein
MSLQALCQIVVDSPASLAQRINHSISYDIHINFMYLAYDTSLLQRTLDEELGAIRP